MNKIQQTALKTEALKVAYNGMTAQQKADAMNTNFSTVKFNKVEYADVLSYLMVVGKWIPIKDSAVVAARELVDAVDKFNTFDLGKPLVKTKVEGTLDALITATLLDATDKTNILGLANVTVSYEILGRDVKAFEITNAEVDG